MICLYLANVAPPEPVLASPGLAERGGRPAGKCMRYRAFGSSLVRLMQGMQHKGVVHLRGSAAQVHRVQKEYFAQEKGKHQDRRLHLGMPPAQAALGCRCAAAAGSATLDGRASAQKVLHHLHTCPTADGSARPGQLADEAHRQNSTPGPVQVLMHVLGGVQESITRKMHLMGWGCDGQKRRQRR